MKEKLQISITKSKIFSLTWFKNDIKDNYTFMNGENKQYFTTLDKKNVPNSKILHISDEISCSEFV